MVGQKVIPYIIVFIIFSITRENFVCSWDAEFITDFLKIQEDISCVNIFVEPQKKMTIKNISNILSSNYFKSSIVLNSKDFLIHSSDAVTTLKILNMEYKESVEILHKAVKLGLFRAPNKWIIFGSISDFQKYDLYFRVDSRIFLCEKVSNGYNISTIYKENENVRIYRTDPIGLWNRNDGFVHYKPLSVYKERRNLRGTYFPLSYLFNSAITYKTVFEYRMTHIDSSPRFTYLITHILISIFNITPTFIKQNSYGVPIPNSTEYTGIIGDIKSGRAIMGATPVFFLTSRSYVVDYIAPNCKSYLNFHFKSPPLSYVSNIFVKPFNEYVWYSCFILIALTLATTYIILKWEWKEPYFRRYIENSTDATKPSISNVAILQLGVISQQGSDTELKSSSGRIAMISALVAFMFLYTAYAANIVAILQSTSESIRELKDLLNSGMELGVEKIPYMINIFKNASHLIGKEIYERKLKPKGNQYLMSLADGTEKMRSQFFAFYTEQSSINKLMSDYFDEAEKCSVRQVEFVKVREPWFITQKNGSYNELLKIGLLKIREAGFYMAERKRIFHEIPTCHSKISRFFSAGLLDTYPGFLFFGVGCILGLFVFCMETLIDKLQKSKSETNGIVGCVFRKSKDFFH